MKNASVLALTVSSALFLAACGSESDTSGSNDGTVNITLAVPVPENGMMDGTNWWAKEIESRSDGDVTFEIFYNGSLIPGTETLAAMADGRVDGGWIADAYYPKEMPVFQVSGIPFNTDNGYANAHSLYDQSKNEDSPLAKEFAANDLYVTHFVPYATTIFATNEPLDSMESLSGKRLRATGTMASVLEDAGAEPVFVEGPSIFESLDRGILDGLAGYPVDVAADSGFGEATKYFTDTGYGDYAATAIAITPDKFASLSSEQQGIVNDVSAELQERSGKFLAENELEACKRLVSENVTLTTWDQSEIEAFKSILKDKYRKKYIDSLEGAGLEPQAIETFMSDYETSYDKYLDTGDYTPDISACQGG